MYRILERQTEQVAERHVRPLRLTPGIGRAGDLRFVGAEVAIGNAPGPLLGRNRRCNLGRRLVPAVQPAVLSRHPDRPQEGDVSWTGNRREKRLVMERRLARQFRPERFITQHRYPPPP